MIRLIEVLALQFCLAQALDLKHCAGRIAEFVQSNSAGRSVTLVPVSYMSDFDYSVKIVRHLAFRDSLDKIRLLTSMDNINKDVVLHEDFVLVILSLPSITSFAKIFEKLHPLKIQTSAVLVTSDLTDTVFQDLKNAGEQLLESSFFYLVHMSSTNTFSWHQVITLKGQSQVIVNELVFQHGNNNELVIVEDYDLQGLNITSYSLPWAPYLKLDDCNEFGMECNSYGSHFDLALMVGAHHNFTLTSFADPDGDWGVLSKNGIFNLTHGEWGGVMGKVMLGDYPLALSEWRYLYERNDLMDFALTDDNRFIMALTPQPLRVDMDLFIRPFTRQSWRAIFLLLAVVITTLVAPFYFMSNFKATSGYLIVYTTAWGFFLLLNAYYGGALTMFFTSKVSVPFESERDVIRAYPTWKLIIRDGGQSSYQFQVSSGDQDYMALWNRMEEFPEETLFPSVKEGLEMIAADRKVMHVFEGQLRGFFRENPFHHQSLQIFGRASTNLLQGLMFTKNSPLKPIFDFGLSCLREKGTLRRIYEFWEGRPVQSNTEADKIVLSLGQVILVYLIIGGAVALSLTVLIGEKIWASARYCVTTRRTDVASFRFSEQK